MGVGKGLGGEGPPVRGAPVTNPIPPRGVTVMLKETADLPVLVMTMVWFPPFALAKDSPAWKQSLPFVGTSRASHLLLSLLLHTSPVCSYAAASQLSS